MVMEDSCFIRCFTYCKKNPQNKTGTAWDKASLYALLLIVISQCFCIHWPTCHPHHDEDLRPCEASGLHPEDLERVVRYRDVGQSGDTLEAVRCVKDEQTEEDDERSCVSHKLHKRTSQDLPQLETANTPHSHTQCPYQDRGLLHRNQQYHGSNHLLFNH